MRRAAKVDANQSEIVLGLRRMGCSVQPLHSVGQGCPDILVGLRGANWLLELKDGAKPPSARKHTADQVDWHEAWRGQVATVATLKEACSVIGLAAFFKE